MIRRQRTWGYIFIVIMMSIIGGNGVSACYVPMIFNPDHDTFDAVVLVEVLNDYEPSRSDSIPSHVMQTRIIKTITGKISENELALRWSGTNFRGPCGSSSPILHKGEKAMVYLSKNRSGETNATSPNLNVIGWVRTSSSPAAE